MSEDTCPYCGSTDIADDPEKPLRICLDCDNAWKPKGAS